ncbi:hypothetical protein ANN_11274 [Periplaneta americana]|uniref:Uncharacterized protein n=1 Tax=Periplaneta americana TaxID=6978 RepID=A0ABQ8T4J5_PERAM|nr:hypothetical protein ANN_11274 [Periplaneta americana]
MKQSTIDKRRRNYGKVYTSARVIMACRDMKKAEDAAADIRLQTKGSEGAGMVEVVQLDLASLASVRKCAQHLLDTQTRIHILVNNAGVCFYPKAVTEDGFEMHMAVNHFGHFLLTCLLLPRIIRSGTARIDKRITYEVGTVPYEVGTVPYEVGTVPLQKYTGGKIPDESTLRKVHVKRIYDKNIEEIRNELENERVWISIDETTNGNIKIGDLSFEEVEKFKYLEATVTKNDTREEIKSE